MKFGDDILLRVEKPGRYTGGEINMVRKLPCEGLIRFGFCFPDVYEVGMSHLGMQILYYFINRRDDAYCERFFAPWTDMESLMRDENIKLSSLETGAEASGFDILGFTLQYEMSYTNVINMLDLSGIPLLAANRGDGFPIVCAGGPGALNPEPLADVADFFYVGEGEVCLDSVIDTYKKCRGMKKEEILFELAGIEGIYVPRFYDVTYGADGMIKSFAPNRPGVPERIRRVYVSDLDSAFFPEAFLVPLIETVHERAALELFRGCSRGCRFCHAGFTSRPVREKTPETLMSQAKNLIKNTGYEEISLVSLSTNDYSCFKELSRELTGHFSGEHINLSLPSLRADAFTLELMQSSANVRSSGLTFAPEAGSQRLRDVINKGLSEQDILGGAAMAFNSGVDRVKLYFMAGLPTESWDDLKQAALLTEKITDEYYKLPKEKRTRGVSVSVSSACFVPKPHTPFQWEKQDSAEDFAEKQKYIKSLIKKKQVRYSYHDTLTAVIEGVISRGDRRVSSLIIKAWELGARFDGWSERFDFKIWEEAFRATGLDAKFYTGFRDLGQILPWDHIDTGVTKDFLLKEREAAYAARTTPDCRQGCARCGAGCG